MTFGKVQSIRKLSAALTAASLLVAGPALAGNRDGFQPQELPWSPTQERLASAKQKQVEPQSPLSLAMQDRRASATEKPDAMLDQGSGGGFGSATSASAPSLESDPFDRSMDAGG